MSAAPLILPVLTEEGDFALYAQTRYGLDVAGERLFRAQPWPEVQWRSATESEAAEQARTLQRYLDSVYAKKGPSKAKLREHGDD